MTALKKLDREGHAEIEFKHPYVGEHSTAGLGSGSGIYFPDPDGLARIQGMVDLENAGWTQGILAQDVFGYLNLEGLGGTHQTHRVALRRNGEFDFELERGRFAVTCDRKPIAEPKVVGDPRIIDTSTGSKTGLIIKINP